MLLMKAWLETRWRLLFVLAATLGVFLTAESGGGLRSPENAHNLLGMILLLSVIWAINLAGAGISTQSAFRRAKGLHGSLYFTLSLPASRLRLLMVRAGLGLLESAVVTVLMFCLAWILFPLVRGNSPLFDLQKMILAVMPCSICFYFVSVLFATLLDDAWQVWGSMLLFGAVRWSSQRFASSFDVFGFARNGSPLITHRLPWTVMTIWIFASILLFCVAVKIVQSREY